MALPAGRTDAAGTGKKEPAATHAVFFPLPAQGHVKAFLQLARLVHARAGVRVTFVHTERNRRRMLRSQGPDAFAGMPPGFGFAFVPDGLPPPSDDGEIHSPEQMDALFVSLGAFVPHLRNVVQDAAASGSPVTCVVSDMESVLRATREELGVPAVAFWTTSACGLMSGLLCQQLIDRGYVPLKDAEQLSNGYLDRTVIDWAPGMPRDMRLRDFLGFIRTTDPDDGVLRALLGLMDSLRSAPSAVVLNTFDELEAEVLHAMASILAPVYTVGPLPLLATGNNGTSLFKEEDRCLAWLGGNKRRPRSVVYANFGSITVLTSRQLREFAWGLADSGHDFLLVARDDDQAVLTPEFADATGGRGYVASWCPQEEVLRHEAVGAFLTHCGWNSVLESVCSGVPLLCWPVAADQQTNSRFACTEWRVGVEVAADVQRAQVAELVREVMGGERGREVRQRAAEWKERAAAAAELPGGTSWVNLERLVNQEFHQRSSQAP